MFVGKMGGEVDRILKKYKDRFHGGKYITLHPSYKV